jgi:glucose-1-phosphate cytidylyltransferase
MKVVLLAGGLGTRLREETEFRPKPMVAIGTRPILWHIMKGYAHYGHRDFVVCLGYKGDIIRDYFLNYEVRHRDVTVTLGSGDVHVHGSHAESGWAVTLAETGETTRTGGRLGRVARFLLDGERFMVTYGDGVADIDLDRLLEFHRSHGKLATLTAVRPSSRFGEVVIDDNMVQVFQEKPQVQGGWINGGYFVFERAVLDIIAGDEESLEQSLLIKLTGMKQLAVYQHTGFWQCMDTPREMELLNDLWRHDKAAWAVWR